MRARALAWAGAMLWAATIFALSARPTLPVSLGSGRDKVVHFLAYALLGALLARAVEEPRRLWLAALLGVAYGASDEMHQRYVPGRSAELADLAADALGVVAAVSLFYLHRVRARARRNRLRAPGTLTDPTRT